MNRKLFFLSTALLLPTATYFAARPLTVDDTDPIGSGTFPFDFGMENTVADSDECAFPTNLAYGLAPDLQVQIGTGVSTQNDPTLGRARFERFRIGNQMEIL